MVAYASSATRAMQQRVLSPVSLLLCLAAIIISFYAGYSRSSINDSLKLLEKSTKDCRMVDQIIIDAEVVKRRVEEKIIKISGSGGARRQHTKLYNGQRQQQHPSYIQGMTRVSKQEFMSTFDNFGLATLESTTPTNDDEEEVLLIYNHAKSVPPILQHSSKLTRLKNITEAIQNCDSLNIQFTHTPIGFHPQCHLWIPASTNNLPSFHVDRYMRLLLQQQQNNHHKLFDHNSPLKHVRCNFYTRRCRSI